MGRKGPKVLQYDSELWRTLTEPDEDDDGETVDPDGLFPRSRDECINGPRPCPFVRCEHHTYLHVSRSGTIWIGRPEVLPWEMEDSCMLDLFDQMIEGEQDERARDLNGYTLKRVGRAIGVTRERTRQLELEALRKLRAYFDEAGITWEDLCPEDEGTEDPHLLASGDE